MRPLRHPGERKTRDVALGAILLTVSMPALSQRAALTQPAALQKAIAILHGDPYGKTPAAVRQPIVGTALVVPGSRAQDACGPTKKPVWVFDVAVPATSGPAAHEAIRGALVLDAATGKMERATLPFLD